MLTSAFKNDFFDHIWVNKHFKNRQNTFWDIWKNVRGDLLFWLKALFNNFSL